MFFEGVLYHLTSFRQLGAKAPLHWALFGGGIETIQILLENGRDPNVKDKDGKTSLHWVSRYGYIKAAKIILAKGVDPNLEDVNERTSFDENTALK